MKSATSTDKAEAFLSAARRLYRHRKATGNASLNADDMCTCGWCRAVRDFISAGKQDLIARRKRK